MSDPDRAMRVVEASDAASVEQARRLFRDYATEFPNSITESFRLQGFKADLRCCPDDTPPSECRL
jgi:hypothetical protein